MHRSLTKGSRVGGWSRNRWTESSICLVTVSREQKWKSPSLCGTYRPPAEDRQPPPNAPPLAHQLHFHVFHLFPSGRCLSTPDISPTQYAQLPTTPLPCCDTISTRVFCRCSHTLLSPRQLSATFHTYRPSCRWHAHHLSRCRNPGPLYARTECGARLERGSDSPDVSKPEILLLLGKMTRNAYIEPDADGWYNLTDEWDVVRSLLSKSGFRKVRTSAAHTSRLGAE